MKRIISLLLVLGMSLTMAAGCAGSGEAAAEPKAEATQTDAAAKETDAAAKETDAAAKETQAQAVSQSTDIAEVFSNSVSMPMNKYSQEWDCPLTGFSFTVPESMKACKGQAFPTDGGETAAGSGIFVGYIHYLARSDAEQIAFDQYLEPLYAMNSLDEQTRKEYEEKASEYYGGRNDIVLVIMGLSSDRNFGDVMANELAGFPVSESGEIGSTDGYHFYYIVPDYSSEADGLAASMTQEFYPEFTGLMENAQELVSNITVKQPTQINSAEKGEKLSFTATDLDGNTLTSQELFGGQKVTMINIWATWCGPCRNELADLEELSKEAAAKGCRVIGICDDAEAGTDTVETAKSILAEKGVTYTNLTSTVEIYNVLTVTAFPTTYFVDSEGKILTDPVIGADFNGYKAAMEEALEAASE